MRISTTSQKLHKSILKLNKAIPLRTTQPILNSILFTVNDDGVILRTTDMEITIVSKLEASVEEMGTAAIPIRKLMEVTSELQDHRITISVDENLKVELITDGGIYDLMGKPTEEYPSLPEVDGRKETGITTKILKEIIQTTLFAASKEDMKPVLTGVLFRFEEDKLLSVATDGHRLVRYIRKDFSRDEITGDVVVPRKFLNLINGLIEDEDKIHLRMGEKSLTATIGNDTIFTRIITQKFPDYENVIPSDNDKIIKTNRKELLSAVKRVSIFSNLKTQLIAINIKNDKAIISTEDPEMSSKAEEEISVELDGEEITIGYNADYLKEILTHLKSENIIFKLKTPISASLVYPEKQENNSDVTMLIMPIRLND